jgi:hypothetical protein
MIVLRDYQLPESQFAEHHMAPDHRQGAQLGYLPVP